MRKYPLYWYLDHCNNNNKLQRSVMKERPHKKIKEETPTYSQLDCTTPSCVNY